MPEHGHRNSEDDAPNGNAAPVERTFVHRVLRYVPNLLRDEWINIGVLLYDPETGERSLRLIEDTTEFNRVRRLHPRFDESALRGLRDHLESRFGSAIKTNGDGGPIHSTLRNGQGNPMPHSTEWLQVLEKWDATLSQSLQLAEPKATIADDLEEEIDRLYDERVAVPRIKALRLGRPTTRAQMRKYCKQVLKQARIWDRIERRIPASDFTYQGDPCGSTMVTGVTTTECEDSCKRSLSTEVCWMLKPTLTQRVISLIESKPASTPSSPR